jgi:hypothetical protein
MQHQNKYLFGLALLCAFAFSAGAAECQQQDPQKTSNGSAAPIAPDTTGQQQQGQATPPVSPVASPSTPVTGVLAPSAGAQGDTQSMLQLGFQGSEGLDTNPLGISSSGSSQLESVTSVGAHLSLHRQRETSDLSLQFVGGGIFYPTLSQYNSTYQELGISESLGFRRWSLHFNDQMSYLPQSAFGFDSGGLAGLGGIAGSPLSGVTLLNPNVAPNQTILSLQTRQLSNIVTGQATIHSSFRSTWTLNADYGVLHYFESGYLNPSNYDVGIGYNYSLSRQDVFGVSYKLDLIRFGSGYGSIDDHIVLFTYGHHVTERLSFQAGAGPDYYREYLYTAPQATSSVQWAANVGVSYQYNRVALQASGYRGVSGGAGIFAGAETSGVALTAGRPLTRLWSASVNTGYTINQALSQSLDTTTSSYQAWFIGASAARTLSRSAKLFILYSLERQASGGCTGAVCVNQFYSNQLSVGFNWDLHPIELN